TCVLTLGGAGTAGAASCTFCGASCMGFETLGKAISPTPNAATPPASKIFLPFIMSSPALLDARIFKRYFPSRAFKSSFSNSRPQRHHADAAIHRVQLDRRSALA